MCQKAVGGPFAAFASIGLEDFAWTRARPQSFRSSSLSTRDFCAACGTPLAYRMIGGRNIWCTTGSFDDPNRVVPAAQLGRESKLAWADTIGRLPGKTTGENMGEATLAGIVSYQHPDHDTQDPWSPPRPEDR
jgi:hypothetical protein